MTTTTILILSYFFINTFIAGSMFGDPECFQETKEEKGLSMAIFILSLSFLFAFPGWLLYSLRKMIHKNDH
jgi:hypothetical protein